MRYADAQCLYQHNQFAGAFYIAGYVIELLLKAKVCLTLGIPDFFDFSKPQKRKFKNEGNLYKPFKVHDFDQLLILSGIINEFEIAMADSQFKADWSVINQWGEDSRYLLNLNEIEVKDFLTSVENFSIWIRKRL